MISQVTFEGGGVNSRHGCVCGTACLPVGANLLQVLIGSVQALLG